jgi:hypothetical protein
MVTDFNSSVDSSTSTNKLLPTINDCSAPSLTLFWTPDWSVLSVAAADVLWIMVASQNILLYSFVVGVRVEVLQQYRHCLYETYIAGVRFEKWQSCMHGLMGTIDSKKNIDSLRVYSNEDMYSSSHVQKGCVIQVDTKTLGFSVKSVDSNCCIDYHIRVAGAHRTYVQDLRGHLRLLES